jgi:hypothetical protein
MAFKRTKAKCVVVSGIHVKQGQCIPYFNGMVGNFLGEISNSVYTP